MDNVSIGIGTRLVIGAFKLFPKMLKRFAAKYAPFEAQRLVITPQPATVLHNAAEHLCVLSLSLSIHNNTFYALRLLNLRVGLEINQRHYAWLALDQQLPLALHEQTTVQLNRPLTEFEYQRALQLFDAASMQTCACTIGWQNETPFGFSTHEQRAQTAIQLVQL